MPAHYTYLISGLPMLLFGAKPAINSRRLLDSCHGIIPEDEFGILQSLLEGKEPASNSGALRQWIKFGTALRNELTKLRAGRSKKDANKYLRQDGYWSPAVTHAAMNAYKNTSILDAERMLDEQRWAFLDEICTGHYFDFDFLVVYALKLLILERWEKISGADKEKLLEDAVSQ